jgi:hypothetical protein
MPRRTASRPAWDFFIAHAGADRRTAERLFDLLDGRSKVFLDSRRLLPGDDWDASLARAQQDSLITVVLVSPRTQAAYYQREEIAAAIALARDPTNRHRVVPVVMPAATGARAAVPYGLGLKHALTLSTRFTLSDAAERLLELLSELRGGAATRRRPRADASAAAASTVLSAAATRARERIEHHIADVQEALAEGIVDRKAALERASASCLLAAHEQRDAQLSAEEVESIFFEGSQGARMVALALAAELRSRAVLPITLLAIREPLTPWEQYRALALGWQLLPDLSAAQKRQLEAAIRAQVGDGPRQYLIPANEGRWQLARQVLGALGKPLRRSAG